MPDLATTAPRAQEDRIDTLAQQAARIRQSSARAALAHFDGMAETHAEALVHVAANVVKARDHDPDVLRLLALLHHRGTADVLAIWREQRAERPGDPLADARYGHVLAEAVTA